MTTRRTFVVGSGGQIGRALTALLGDAGRSVGRDELDLATPRAVKPALDALARDAGVPAAVINAAAFTRVDDAESHEPMALRVNADAPREMAEWCRDRAVPFVHYSTDYAYSGAGEKPWQEDDEPAPLNAYGRTKLAGDRLVTAAGGPHLIFRTLWVYDAHGRNFFNTILRLARERATLRIVSDQIGTPSYAPHLAQGTLAALEKATTLERFPSGIYHLANRGTVSWHGFASAICEAAARRGVPLKATRIDAIATSEYPVTAARPLNSRLDLSKLRSTFGLELPTWQAGVDECLDAWSRNAAS